MIRPNNNGFVVPTNDVVNYAGAFEHATDNCEELVKKGTKSQNFTNQFDSNKPSKEFVSWLEKTKE